MKPKTLYLVCLTTLSIATVPLTQAEEQQTTAAATEKPTGVCFCLSHINKAIGSIIKNCEWNQRPNEPEPHLFCMGAAGKDNTPKKLKNWQTLPADHADCKPCDAVEPAAGSGPIRGD